MVKIDAFQLVAIVIGFASVTSWLTIRNAKQLAEIRDFPLELIAMAISWMAATIVSYLIFR